MDLTEALDWLDGRAGYDKTGRVDSPSLDNITRLLRALGDPHLAYKTIHVTGTNGKGSTTQIISRLLEAHGLRVGTYVSPHLESVNERIQIDCVPVDDDTLAACISAVADVELVAGVRPSYFEIMTAAGFRCFADAAVDVAVIEVGMLGRWDATNVIEPEVAVITNIALDHTDYAGPTLADIAREKAGIIKADSAVVVGEPRESLWPVFAAEEHRSMRIVGEDFACLDNHLALGGRMLRLRTPRSETDELFLPLHGEHQGHNALVATVAVEEFFDAPLDVEIVAEAFSRVTMPGRFEILARQPLVILDGAHNAAGADSCAGVFFGDFDPDGRRLAVFGALRGRDVGETLSAVRADDFDVLWCTTANSPRAVPAEEIAAAARAMGCEDVRVRASVTAAVDEALADAGAEDALLVTGSLYVVGEARPHLVRKMP